MFANHQVYKGYRLSVQVQRVLPQAADAGLDGVTFRATLVVSRADNEDADKIEYAVPSFVQGEGVHTPAQAIHIAIEYGRTMVEAWSSQADPDRP